MCSVNDAEHSGSTLMERRPIDNKSWTTVCQKCAEAKPVIQIMQIKHAYCRICFLSHVSHKFRSTLGKSKMMRPSDVVLASFSGSLKSLALLHLLRAGLSEKSHKKFLFKVHVLYIDEGALLQIPIQDRECNLKAIGAMVSLLGFSLYFTTLSSVYDSSRPQCSLWEEGCSLNLSEDGEKNLVELFDNTITLTAKEDLLRQLRRSLMLKSATEIGCGKLLLAETGTDLAVQILSDISLGRGSQMHHDVSFCDDRAEGVKILRPMRELTSKEVAFYTVYNSLDGINIPSLCTKMKVNESIQRLSEHFVMHLMEEFPSTVSTVFRTGDKLGSNSSPSVTSEDENERICAICKATKDIDNAECSSVQATSFSRLVSSLGPTGFDHSSLKPLGNTSEIRDLEPLLFPPSPFPRPSSSHTTSCVISEMPDTVHQFSGDIKFSCINSESGLSHVSIWTNIQKYVCYGCRLILQDMKHGTHLPKSMLEVNQQASIEDMEKSIQEYLL